jgi:hypothetical protein
MNFLFTLSLKVWPFWIPHLNEPQIDRKQIKIEKKSKDYHESWLISVFLFYFQVENDIIGSETNPKLAIVKVAILNIFSLGFQKKLI